MKLLLTIITVIAVVVAIIRAILNTKDEKTEKALNEVRAIAYDAAWKTFAPNHNKKFDRPPFDFRRAVDPPVLAICTGDYWYDDECWDNYFDIYKFVNGKWEFYCKKTLRKAIWGNVTDFEICKKLNCKLCINYLHLEKNRRKSINKTFRCWREEYL